MQLTAGERTLLHLLGFWNAKDVPPEVSQQGIAAGARLRRSHVPRTVKALLREGYLDEREGRIRGRGRRVKTYFLTESGLRRARELAGAVGEQEVATDAGPSTIAALAESSGRSVLGIALDLEDGRRVREGPREEESLVGRREEVAALSRWLAGPAACAVVYGGAGMGKTTLARRVLDRSDRPVWWHDVGSDQVLLRDLARFAGKTDETDPDIIWAAIEAALAGRASVLVLDGYGDVSESEVDGTRRLLAAVRSHPKAKLLVLALETTPSYCRFYERRAVEEGAVQEFHLRGLGPDESRRLLGTPDIAPEALRRIYLLTKGCPRCLELLRTGDADGLLAHTRFTAAEVRLLLFSRDVRA